MDPSTVLQNLSQFDSKSYIRLTGDNVPEVVNPHWAKRFCLWVASLLRWKPAAYRLDRVARETIIFLEKHKSDLQERSDHLDLVGKLRWIAKKDEGLHQRFEAISKKLHQAAVGQRLAGELKTELERRQKEARQEEEHKKLEVIARIEAKIRQDLEAKGTEYRKNAGEADREKEEQIASIQAEVEQERALTQELQQEAHRLTERCEKETRAYVEKGSEFSKKWNELNRTEHKASTVMEWHDRVIICRRATEESGLTYLSTMSAYLQNGSSRAPILLGPITERSQMEEDEEDEEQRSSPGIMSERPESFTPLKAIVGWFRSPSKPESPVATARPRPRSVASKPKVENDIAEIMTTVASKFSHNIKFIDCSQHSETTIRAYLHFLHNKRKQKYLTTELAQELYDFSLVIHDSDLEGKCYPILEPRIRSDHDLLMRVLSGNQYPVGSLLNKGAIGSFLHEGLERWRAFSEERIWREFSSIAFPNLIQILSSSDCNKLGEEKRVYSLANQWLDNKANEIVTWLEKKCLETVVENIKIHLATMDIETSEKPEESIFAFFQGNNQEDAKAWIAAHQEKKEQKDMLSEKSILGRIYFEALPKTMLDALVEKGYISKENAYYIERRRERK